jgi:hypothetical protein
MQHARLCLSGYLKNMIDVDTLEATDIDHKSKLFHYAQRYGKKLTFEIASETLKNRRSYFRHQLTARWRRDSYWRGI